MFVLHWTFLPEMVPFQAVHHQLVCRHCYSFLRYQEDLLKSLVSLKRHRMDLCHYWTDSDHTVAKPRTYQFQLEEVSYHIGRVLQEVGEEDWAEDCLLQNCD